VGPDENDVQALADVLQPVIDQITEQGVNKVVLTSHLQQIALEQELIGELSGVDIVIAGGSDTILADNTDTLRSGDEAGDSYPIITENADGDPAAIVSTAGEYSYVGRLVADFDSEGVLIPDSIDPEVSGTFATTDEVVNQVSGNNDPFAEGSKGSQVQTLVDSVEEVVSSQDGNVFGQTEVFLDGRREQVRTEETNLGNLTADANLEAAQAEDDSVVVSIKNGGGIRAPIGEVGDEGELLPPQANPDTGKEQGQISQLDIVNSLRFNNGLTLLDVSRGELEKLIEHSVAGTAPGNTPGQFPQVSGLEFSFDPTEQAIEFNDDGTVATEGDRVQSLAITNEDGETVDVIVEDGELVGDPGEEIRLVTLNFLADGGDGYPFDDFGENRVDLVEPEAERTGEATFANDGSEQDALAEYLADNFPADDDPNTPAFSEEETAPSEDDRIVNLEQQQPDDEPEPEAGGPVFGSTEADTLEATIDFEGGNNVLFTGAGNDQIFASQGEGNNRIYAGKGNDELVASTEDRLFGGAGNDTLEASIGQGNNRLYAGAGNDDLIAGYEDRLFGGDGNDRLFLSEGQFEGGGNNTVTGGAGEDQFWLANAQLPGAANTITDFSAGEDVLGIAGLDLAFADLSIGASEENADNTVIAAANQDLAILTGVQADSLTESNFVFENSAVS
jgi:2',3'-cyclic-nucleotide 2'-phosphodiesterase (5'-nucleotidase family)